MNLQQEIDQIMSEAILEIRNTFRNDDNPADSTGTLKQIIAEATLKIQQLGTAVVKPRETRPDHLCLQLMVRELIEMCKYVILRQQNEEQQALL